MKTHKEKGGYRWFIEPRSDAANKAIGNMLAETGDAHANEAKRIKCHDGKERSLWEVKDFADIQRFVNSEHACHFYRQPGGEGSLPHRWRPPRKSNNDAPIKSAAHM